MQPVFFSSITPGASLQYHQANSKKNTVKTCAFVLSRFAVQFGKRDLASISIEEVLAFLLSLTKANKQATKRNRYSVLASFYNFIINTALPALGNPCSSSVIKKIFKRPQVIQWDIVDKEAVDEIIFRTTNVRNRLMLELMARGGRVGEVLNLKITPLPRAHPLPTLCQPLRPKHLTELYHRNNHQLTMPAYLPLAQQRIKTSSDIRAQEQCEMQNP